MYDMILKGCRLFNGDKFADKETDVAILDGVIAKTGRLDGERARKVIDCAGKTVTPGLVDCHTHISPISSIGADVWRTQLPYGVTAIGEAGGAGCNAVDGLAPIIRNFPVRTKLYLNVCSFGLQSLFSHPEDIDPKKFDVNKIKAIFKKYPELICGLKIRMGRECSQDFGKEPLERAAALARELNTHLCVHISNPEFPTGELCELLAKGDIVTHTYQSRGNGIFIDGELDSRVVAARARGVLFDIGDSDYHFDFEVFEKALEQGFAPDLISSDITRVSAFANGLFALPTVIAKCVSLGMNEEDALRAVTFTPAKALGLSVGKIEEGAVADISVFEIKENFGELCDCKKRKISAKYFPVPMLTVYGGEIAWRSLNFRSDI